MTLLSIELLAWMAAAVAVYWRVPPRFQLPVLTAVTLAFLLVHAPASGLAAGAVALVTYAASRAARLHRLAGLGAIALIAAGFLAYKLLVIQPPGGLPQALALIGFSFYVLRALHYMIEGEKGSLPEHGLGDFLGYMLFFPTLLVGPIHRFGDHLREARRRRWDASLFSGGLERILFGYAKIVVVGQYLLNIKLGQLIDRLHDQAALAAYLECVQYGLHLYVQFSGYSDVALGFALLLGIRLKENFQHPFLKTNIFAFWQAWHISLTSWCRDYVYTPLVAWLRRPLLASLCAMLVLGLWHEASWRYVAWGAYHGAGIMAWQAFQGWKPSLPALEHPMARLAARGAAWFLTFNFVTLSFAITKEADLAATWAVYRQLLNL